MCLNQFFILFPTEFWMQMFTNDHLMFIALLEIMLGNISIGPDPGICSNVSHGFVICIITERYQCKSHLNIK